MIAKHQPPAQPGKPSLRHWSRKFLVAGTGILGGIQGHSSFYIHIPAALGVLFAAAVLGMHVWEWAVLLLCIALVMTAELFNSALETLARALHDQPDAPIGQALDIAAGAVLFACVASAVIGGVIFLQRIGELRAGCGN